MDVPLGQWRQNLKALGSIRAFWRSRKSQRSVRSRTCIVGKTLLAGRDKSRRTKWSRKNSSFLLLVAFHRLPWRMSPNLLRSTPFFWAERVPKKTRNYPMLAAKGDSSSYGRRRGRKKDAVSGKEATLSWATWTSARRISWTVYLCLDTIRRFHVVSTPFWDVATRSRVWSCRRAISGVLCFLVQVSLTRIMFA